MHSGYLLLTFSSCLSFVFHIVLRYKGIFYGALNAHGISISHFPQTSAPVLASFIIQISKHFFLSNPSVVNAPEKQFFTHFLQPPFFLYKQRSSLRIWSGSTGRSATTEPYRPQHPFSEINILLIPKVPSPAA